MKRTLLTESASIDDIKSQPYFSKFPDLRLLRGVRKDIDDIIHIPFRYRDKPLDTDVHLHNAVNEESITEFGLPIRNLIFATEHKENAAKYGSVYVIVPKGDKFRLFYHPNIEDMTGAYDAADADFMSRIMESAIEYMMELDIPNDVLDGMFSDYEDDILNAVRRIKIHTRNYGQEIEKSLYTNLKDDIDSDSAREISSMIADRIMEDVNDGIERVAREYVEGIEEATRDDEYTPSIDYPEIMLYAPDGVYLVQEYLFDD